MQSGEKSAAVATDGVQLAWHPKPSRALKPDAQAFDEVRIVTVPRFKESGLSGDEWRISATIQFWRKGRLVHEVGSRNVEAACAQVGYRHANACDEGNAFFAGENLPAEEGGAPICDQEGCHSIATVTYRLKKGFSRDGHERQLFTGGEYRCFCERHKHRGNCSLEDSDDNYEPAALSAAQAGRST